MSLCLLPELGDPDLLLDVIDDLDGDGDTDDLVLIRDPDDRGYDVLVVPCTGADPDAQVTLMTIQRGSVQILLDAERVADLPEDPIPVNSDSTPPTITVSPSTHTIEGDLDAFQEISLDVSVADNLTSSPRTFLLSVDGDLPVGPSDVGVESWSGSTCTLSLRAAWVGTEPQVYTLTFAAVDDAGNMATADVTVEVVDTTPPEISLEASRTSLWPPNHAMVDVGLSVLVSDGVDAVPSCTVLISSSEADDAAGGGDGSTQGDIEIVGFGSESYVSFHGQNWVECSLKDVADLWLCAERQGSGDGRVYTIQVTATDFAGNTSVAVRYVTVPKSQGH